MKSRRNRVVSAILSLPACLCLLAPASAAHPSLHNPTATIYRHQTPDDAQYFALALEAPKLPAPKVAVRHLVILVDTSASQVGEHRRQTLEVVESLLSLLPAEDRVTLFAVDVMTQRLNPQFQSASSESVARAMTTLKRRVPLGATNLHAALKEVARVFESIANEQVNGEVLYIGDGMSTGGLIQSQSLAEVLAQFRERNVPIHCYAVGPQTDLDLLGMLAQQTGGVVKFDRADAERDAAQAVARDLNAAIHAPVFYPSELKVDPAVGMLLPQIPLPLRNDRATVYLGTGQPRGDAEITLMGEGDGEPVVYSWNLDSGRQHDGFAFLKPMWRRAESDNGVSVSLAGHALISAAQDAFDDRVSGLVGLGEQAAAARQFRQAEQLGEAVRELDPENARVQELLNRVERLQVRTVAQVPPQPNNNQPGEVPPEPKPPAADGSLFDQLPGFQSGIQPPPSEGSLILEQEERQAVRSEQLTLEVEQSIQVAREIAVSEPDVALTELKRTLGTVVSAEDVFPEVRERLTRRVRGVIQEVVNQQATVEQGRELAIERRAQLEAEERLIEDLLLEEEALEQLIDRVRGLLNEGRHGNDAAYELAEEVAEQAVDLRPGSGVAEAARFTAEAAGALNQAFRLRALRADRFLEVLYQVELSHVPFPDEPPIRWPPAAVWQQLTQQRKKWASVDLHRNSPSEERIQAALREETETGFIDTPLRDAIDFIEELHGIQIHIDEPALIEEGLAVDEPITLDLSGITLRSALKIMLEPLGLTYVIEDEVMKITTQVVAEETLQTRVYPVGDLVIPITTPQSAGLGQGLGGVGGLGGGQGGLGGGGQFGAGGAGFGGGGMGQFSVPADQVPRRMRDGAKRRSAAPPKVRDSELRGIMDGIRDQRTSQRESQPAGQYFAQINDSLPAGDNVFDNETVKSLKKKRLIER